MNKQVVLRFAPSPTGPLHIGGVRTALYNHLFAKQNDNTRFILRIEDTDRTRYVPGAEEYIIESLKWLGIEFNEGVSFGGDKGPYRQSDRATAGIYRKYVELLIENGKAYYAFDTSEELDAMRERLKAEGNSVQQYNHLTRGEMKNSLTLPESDWKARIEAGEPYVVRMNMPANEEVSFKDIVREEVTFNSNQLDDKILMKSDGMPTYHLANVVDDHLMEITHVIRGEEWLSSTPLHVLLYRAFGWEDTIPQFVHLPLILNPNGKGKLSKRTADQLGFPVFPQDWTDPQSGNFSQGFKEAGYEPDALINYLSLLGWNPGNDEEIMDENRLVELFSLERIGKAGAKFDPEKLKWFNENYLRAKSSDDLLVPVKEELAKAGKNIPDDNFILGLIDLMKDRVSFAKEFVSNSEFLLSAPTSFDEKTTRKRWKTEPVELLKELVEDFSQLSNWESQTIHDAFQSFIQRKEVGLGKIMAPLRLALTGLGSGPGIFDIAALLGKEESLSRLTYAIKNLPVNS
jgi:glutamyl-tRNA synthetase